jgi:hypothetical protein
MDPNVYAMRCFNSPPQVVSLGGMNDRSSTLMRARASYRRAYAWRTCMSINRTPGHHPTNRWDARL